MNRSRRIGGYWRNLRQVGTVTARLRRAWIVMVAIGHFGAVLFLFCQSANARGDFMIGVGKEVVVNNGKIDQSQTINNYHITHNQTLDPKDVASVVRQEVDRANATIRAIAAQSAYRVDYLRKVQLETAARIESRLMEAQRKGQKKLEDALAAMTVEERQRASEVHSALAKAQDGVRKMVERLQSLQNLLRELRYEDLKQRQAQTEWERRIRKRERERDVWVYAFTGIAAAAAVAGAYFALSAQDASSDSTRLCNSSDICTHEGTDLRRKSRVQATIATISLALAVSTGVGALVLEFTPPVLERPHSEGKTASGWSVVASGRF